jgi:hypothetical protein
LEVKRLKQNNEKNFFCFEAKRLMQNREKKIEAKRCEMKQKKTFLGSQKQAKMKRNRIRFTSFRFEANIKKERKRDTLLINSMYFGKAFFISATFN